MTKRIVVVGAGVGGLSAALALGRAGHDVLLLERDATPMPAAFDDAFGWRRQGAPQFHHSHAFLPRLRSILLERFPDVMSELRRRGVVDRHAAAALFGLPEDTPGVEDIVLLPCRRTTYEWVLRTTIADLSNVELRTGVAVTGLLGGDGPRVRGVHLDDGTTIDADLVVATTGRRGDVPGWLAPLGVTIEERTEESGVAYLSRFYRIRNGRVPYQGGYALGRRAGLAYGTFEADNGTFSITMLPDPTDSEMRQHLGDDGRFQATCELLPELAPVIDRDRAEPITPVHPMAGLINRLRTFVDGDGRPLVEGFVALGDAYMVTNPVYARGCTVAMLQAVALADALAAHPDDASAVLADYEAVCEREVRPWFHLAVLLDQLSLAADDGADFSFGVGAGSGAMAALGQDPHVAVAFSRVFSMLDPPARLYEDPKVMTLMTAGVTRMPNGRPRDGATLRRADLLGVSAA